MEQTGKNVYELAQERLNIIFNDFDNICVSFSGGKDSGVLLNLCIDYIRRNNLKRKLCVFHIDYEIQYSVTIDYVDRILEASRTCGCVRNLPAAITRKTSLSIPKTCGTMSSRCTLPAGFTIGSRRRVRVT